MKWFGESWGAPICSMAEHAPTPIGEACKFCDDKITESDAGLLVPHLPATGGEEYKPWHIRCLLRSIAG